MIFSSRIRSIAKGDRVLEIGPGGTPHSRADVLLELHYNDPREAAKQRGDVPALRSKKPVVYYDGGCFPFADKEFDYVICSHVLEHVPNIEKFLSELFRIAPKGYLEYPTIYYEYLYNFSVHLNLLKYNGKMLFYLEKDATPLGEFQNVQRLYYESLRMGYSDLVEDLRNYMFEGFEWQAPFSCVRADSMNDLTFPIADIRKQSLFVRLTRALVRRLGRMGKAA